MTDNNEWRIRMPDGFERRELDINGIRTVVYSVGSGRPVVYWHGGGTFHGINFARDWAPYFRVILPHHPGFGESGAARGCNSLSDYHRHYLALFDHLGLTQVDLIGLSLGGWMAAEFAADQGDRLRRLVLVAPAGLPDEEYPGTRPDAIPSGEIFSWLAHDVAVFDPHLPRNEDEAAALQRLLEREAATQARIFPDGPVNPELPDRLQRIDVPTLLVWGRNDRIAPPGKADKWLRHLGNAELAVFDEAGHMILDESAAARRAILDFLTA